MEDDQITMKRCVIVGGADISNYDRIIAHIKSDDFVIFCDSGLKHMEKLAVKPSLIVGDFDSHENPHLDVETIVLPCEKDDTDTVFAVKEAIKRGYKEFFLIGVIGARLDHTLGNVYILAYLDQLGYKGRIVDDFSDMELVKDTPVLIDDSYSYFSVLNITGTLQDITIENAKYPLQNAVIQSGYQYGISNEVLKGKTASVKVNVGKGLLIRVF